MAERKATEVMELCHEITQTKTNDAMFMSYMVTGPVVWYAMLGYAMITSYQINGSFFELVRESNGNYNGMELAVNESDGD